MKVRRGMMMQRFRGKVGGNISGNKIIEKEAERIQTCVIHDQCEAGARTLRRTHIKPVKE